MAAKNLKNEMKIPILLEFDVLYARKMAVELATNIGFSEIEQCEIEIIISELGTNIVKHGNKRGLIKLVPFDDLLGAGISIVASNGAPSIKNENLKEWIRNGRYTGQSVRSTSGTMGIGLSAIGRLSNEFDIKIGLDGALTAKVKKWLRITNNYSLKSSVLSKPKKGEYVSGDSYYVKQSKSDFFFCIIDALGHGINAQPVAKKGISVIEKGYFMDIRQIVEECHKGLLDTRGAALCIGKISFTKNSLEYTSIGNIESRIYGRDQTRLISYDGTVGRAIDSYKVHRYSFRKGDCLVSYTDGISNSFTLEKELLGKKTQQIAEAIFSAHAKDYDDATVMVIKS